MTGLGPEERQGERSGEKEKTETRRVSFLFSFVRELFRSPFNVDRVNGKTHR